MPQRVSIKHDGVRAQSVPIPGGSHTIQPGEEIDEIVVGDLPPAIAKSLNEAGVTITLVKDSKGPTKGAKVKTVKIADLESAEVKSAIADAVAGAVASAKDEALKQAKEAFDALRTLPDDAEDDIRLAAFEALAKALGAETDLGTEPQQAGV